MSSPDLENKQLLKSFSLFNNLTSEEIDLFCQRAQRIEVPAGEQFITEGEKGDSIFLLIQGSVEIIQALTLHVNKSETDNREKALTRLDHTMHPFMGEMSLFAEDDRRTASVKATTDCVFMKIMRDDIFDICDHHPETGYKVMRNLCELITKNLIRANKNVLKLTTAFSLVLER